MARSISKKARLVSELSALQRVQADRPSWLRREDFDRMAREFAAKSAELVALEILACRRREGG